MKNLNIICHGKSIPRGMISELNVTPSEEIDLLIRWLGPDSGMHTKTIRSSLSSDPTWGVAKIWERLDERFGAPEMVEAAIKERRSLFPRIGNKDNKKPYELVDVMIKIESLMANPQYTVLLSYFNSSSGVLPIINKLPCNIQEKWPMRAANYKKQHSVPFPPFSLVLNFVKEISKVRNDPSFSYFYEQQAQKANIGSRPALSQKPVIARKMEVKSETKANWNSDEVMYPVHSKPHSLNACREFSKWEILKRREFLKKKGICFKCCETNSHLMKDCKQSVMCADCQSVKHSTAMHIERREQTELDNKRTSTNTMEPQRSHGGENSRGDNQHVIANCTSLCDFTGRSCSKTVLVRVFPYDKPEKAVTICAILDEHSNKTLACSELIDLLGVDSPSTGYRLSSCAGIVHMQGRRATGYVVESWDGTSCHTLPTVIECNKFRMMLRKF